MRRRLFASLLAAGFVLAPVSAHAQSHLQGVDPSGGSLALLLGVGVDNEYGFGLGVRGGDTFRNHLYVGGSFIDHFGDDLNLVLLSGEVGYDVIAGPVVIRPFGGLGFAVPSVGNVTRAAFYPGCAVIYTFPRNERFFVGGDVRVYLIDDFTTFATYGFGGVHF